MSRPSAAAWLAEHDIEKALSTTLASVVADRPADPIAEIARRLMLLSTGKSAQDEEEDAEFEEELKRGDWASNRAAYDAVRMYYRWTFMPVSKDRRRPLQLLASRGVTDFSDRDIYTFGVYTGASMKFWFEGFDALKIRTGPHWGFDSFEGLPAEADGMALECNAWLPGSFSAADQFGAYTFGAVRDKILEHVGPKYAEDTRLIKGFFSDSLTPTLKSEHGMKPALLIDVDVDLYISCVQCMEWMVLQGLLVPGTVVYYDDVSIVKADTGGELKAHDELTAKYGIRWRKLHDSCWEVVEVGGAPQ